MKNGLKRWTARRGYPTGQREPWKRSTTAQNIQTTGADKPAERQFFSSVPSNCISVMPNQNNSCLEALTIEIESKPSIHVHYKISKSSAGIISWPQNKISAPEKRQDMKTPHNEVTVMSTRNPAPWGSRSNGNRQGWRLVSVRVKHKVSANTSNDPLRWSMPQAAEDRHYRKRDYHEWPSSYGIYHWHIKQWLTSINPTSALKRPTQRTAQRYWPWQHKNRPWAPNQVAGIVWLPVPASSVQPVRHAGEKLFEKSYQ